MKVCYLYRSKKLNQHSIENVFREITDSLDSRFEIEQIYLPEYKIGFYNIFKNLLFIKKIKADFFHITGDIHYASLVLPKKRTILTIHDLVGFENYKNKAIKKILYYIFWVLIPVAKSKYITTISYKTKKDLLRICPWASNKMIVIPNPISDKFQYSEKEFNEKNPNILLIGTAKNKNHERIIEAIKDIKCTISIVGEVPTDELKLLERYTINFKSYYNVSDDLIKKLYSNADIILFASTYEGFGMPIIEAQKTGRCVITSDIEPMLEVAGEGACLVNPYDVDDIKEKVLKIINDKRYRTKIIQKGLINAVRYLPSTISKSYEELYNEILSRHNYD